MLAKNHCIRLFLCQLFLVPFGLNLGLTMRHSFNPDCQSYSDYQGREHSPPSPPSPPRQDHPKDVHLPAASFFMASETFFSVDCHSSSTLVLNDLAWDGLRHAHQAMPPATMSRMMIYGR